MKLSGQIVMFRFPQTDLVEGKLRPALLIGKVPGEHDDWLICMISSQIRHCVVGFDELIRESDPDFEESGLRVESIIRVGRLAVVEGSALRGSSGQISTVRMQRVKHSLANWIEDS